LNFYGEGSERKRLQDYISENNLSDSVFLHGNVYFKTLIEAYQEAHFLIFISKSEGWPKVVAESMFWGCIPVTTAVSCVPWMLDQGNRGYLVQEDENMIVEIISKISQAEYNEKSQNASIWSREFTLDKFELEVKRLIK
jgi:glycosyltransferase involved in cell wall biosynthesis